MERSPSGVETHLLDEKAVDAANDPVMAGSRPATGWDPFEIWRTRIRRRRLRYPREGKSSSD